MHLTLTALTDIPRNASLIVKKGWQEQATKKARVAPRFPLSQSLELWLYEAAIIAGSKAPKKYTIASTAPSAKTAFIVTPQQESSSSLSM